MFNRGLYYRMMVEDGWLRLTYRQRKDIMRVILAMKEYDRQLIHDDDYYAVIDSTEPIRVRCAVCLYRRDYKHALEYIEQMVFTME